MKSNIRYCDRRSEDNRQILGPFLRFFKAMACSMPVKYRLNVAVEIKRLQPPLRACLDLAVYL